jgi:ABC-type polar amino acid transport system ATPase subunit
MPDFKRSAAVEIELLNKWYGAFHVLQDVDLEVRRGSRLVICGPSGSGKSTLIRCINGLETFQRGAIRLDGCDLAPGGREAAAARRSTGMVFQSFNLFPHLSVLSNCTLALRRVHGKPKKEAEDIALHYLERVRIPEQAGKFPAQLSGGQQQRVAIARALCLEPKLMLFDEPTSSLDPEMVKEVLDVMISLARDGMTMLCVTHEMGFAREAADEVLFMDEGRIVEKAPPDAFFGRPEHARTRLFLEKILH